MKATKGTNMLLMRVLQIHFKDRLHILDEALIALKNYSNKTASTQSEYYEITATLKNMVNDLPEDILKYFLTLVPPPKNKENLALNDHNVNDIRGILLDYVKSQIETEAKPEKVETPAKAEKRSCETSPTTPPVVAKKKPRKRGPSRPNKTPIECKKLLDICAEYVVKHHTSLSQNYRGNNEEVWKILEDTKPYKAEDLEQLYEVGRYLNTRLKWLRLLEAEEITDEIIRDSYYDEDIFLRESELAPLLNEEPYVITDALHKSILDFVQS